MLLKAQVATNFSTLVFHVISLLKYWIGLKFPIVFPFICCHNTFGIEGCALIYEMNNFEAPKFFWCVRENLTNLVETFFAFNVCLEETVKELDELL